MLKKFLIAAIILTSSFGIATVSEAAQSDNENYCGSDSYCGDYNDRNCEGGYCRYNKERGCR